MRQLAAALIARKGASKLAHSKDGCRSLEQIKDPSGPRLKSCTGSIAIKIARTLTINPKVLIANEPPGNPDSEKRCLTYSALWCTISISVVATSHSLALCIVLIASSRWCMAEPFVKRETQNSYRPGIFR